MATRIAYRLVFALGITALAAAWLLGLGGELVRTGRPPALLVDPLIEAHQEFAGRDPLRWIDEARSLTEIQPRNLGGFLALARALVAAGRSREAIGAYETAQALGPVPPVAHAQLARLYFERGDVAAARAQARSAEDRGVVLAPAFRRALGLGPVARGKGGA